MVIGMMRTEKGVSQAKASFASDLHWWIPCENPADESSKCPLWDLGFGRKGLLCRNDHFSERYAVKKHFFANLRCRGGSQMSVMV